MGQARQRGTFEQRKAAGIKRREEEQRQRVIERSARDELEKRTRANETPAQKKHRTNRSQLGIMLTATALSIAASTYPIKE